MQLLRSLIFTAAFYAGTLVYVLAGLAVNPFSTEAMRSVVRGWARFHRFATRYILGIRLEVQGRVPEGPHLIAVKHQSMFETVEMVLIADTPVVVMKRELVDMPLFGGMTRRWGSIPADREAGPKALRLMVAMAKEALAEKRPVVIFPEGTRVPPGETPPLRPGFAGLYRTLGLPVVPIALDSGRLWGRGLVKRSGTIRFRVGETIPPGLKRDEIEARVHAAINVLESSAP